MATVLVVDDSALDRHLAGTLLGECPGWNVVYAEDGREALTAISQGGLDLVLTDLQMPEMDGLQLVEAVCREYPIVPIILMTAHGSEDIAAAALKLGAASYVPKRNLARDLVETVAEVLDVAQARRDHQLALACLDETEARFILTNEPAERSAVVSALQDQLTQMQLVDRSGLIRVGTALHEVLVNAVEHGNLELGSELREGTAYQTYHQFVDERRRQLPYRDRRVYVHARLSRAQAVIVVRDEGRGFDPTTLPNPLDPANLEKSSGRGLILIRTFLDEVTFNDKGNQITLTKRRQS